MCYSHNLILAYKINSSLHFITQMSQSEVKDQKSKDLPELYAPNYWIKLSTMTSLAIKFIKGTQNYLRTNKVIILY